MSNQPLNPLNNDALEAVFTEQLSVLYGAKNFLIAAIPELIEQATFKNLKLALQEDLEETLVQMINLKMLFAELKAYALTDCCLAMDSIIAEAAKQVKLYGDDPYRSDMTIIFYMSVIENMQIGAARVLNAIACMPSLEKYKPLVTKNAGYA